MKSKFFLMILGVSILTSGCDQYSPSTYPERMGGINVDPVQKKEIKTKKSLIDSIDSKYKSEVKILEFSYSECLKNCDLTSKIIDQSIKENIYSVTFGAHLNCAGKFISNVEVINDTLNFIVRLKTNKKGLVISHTCNCFYHLNYRIKGLNKIPKQILLEGLTLKEHQKHNANLIDLGDSL